MQVSTIGLDLAKQVFQVHGVDVEGMVVLRRRLRRSEVVKFFSTLPGCLIGIEACATARHRARGTEARSGLIPALLREALCQIWQDGCVNHDPPYDMFRCKPPIGVAPLV